MLDTADTALTVRYPLVLVHGAGFRDSFLGMSYWGRIIPRLRAAGATVYTGGTDAWGSVERNAALLGRRIDRIREETGAAKVNIIAHSRGGLEARYLISTLHRDDAVASLTTIATPHRGVKAMDYALGLPDWLYRAASGVVNGWFRLLGDRDPDFYPSSRMLAARSSVGFNAANPDSPAVQYLSYAARLKHWFSDPSYLLLQPLLRRTDGENDGLCPVESARWGTFLGVVTTGGHFGISHAGIIDAYRVPYKGVDIPGLYLALVETLAERGC